MERRLVNIQRVGDLKVLLKEYDDLFINFGSEKFNNDLSDNSKKKKKQTKRELVLKVS